MYLSLELKFSSRKSKLKHYLKNINDLMNSLLRLTSQYHM